jgi:hypothetical protein
MNGISWSLVVHACLGCNVQTFANGHLKLLRVQDKKDSADGDVGVPPLPNNYRSYNIRVESMQI